MVFTLFNLSPVNVGGVGLYICMCNSIKYRIRRSAPGFSYSLRDV